MNKEASELGSYTTAEQRAGENHRNFFFFFYESVAQKEQSGRRREGEKKLLDPTQKVGNPYFLNFAIVSRNTNQKSGCSSRLKTQRGTWSAVYRKDVLKMTALYKRDVKG